MDGIHGINALIGKILRLPRRLYLRWCWRPGKVYRVDIDEDNLPNEIVGRGFFHLERLDDKEWYLNLGDIKFYFHTKRKILPLVDHKSWKDVTKIP